MNSLKLIDYTITHVNTYKEMWFNIFKNCNIHLEEIGYLMSTQMLTLNFFLLRGPGLYFLGNSQGFVVLNVWTTKSLSHLTHGIVSTKPWSVVNWYFLDISIVKHYIVFVTSIRLNFFCPNVFTSVFLFH